MPLMKQVSGGKMEEKEKKSTMKKGRAGDSRTEEEHNVNIRIIYVIVIIVSS